MALLNQGYGLGGGLLGRYAPMRSHDMGGYSGMEPVNQWQGMTPEAMSATRPQNPWQGMTPEAMSAMTPNGRWAGIQGGFKNLLNNPGLLNFGMNLIEQGQWRPYY
jgi:hypothetical protein